MREIMIDLETMGNKQNSVIVSIGAVAFDFEKDELGPTFYEKVSIDSCLGIGLEVMGSTIKWWLSQSDSARSEIGIDAISIQHALFKFNQYFTSIVNGRKTTEVNVWGNPTSFDIGILSNAYEKSKLLAPWHYRNERDLRTLVSLYPEIKAKTATVGTLHNPVDDCKTQIMYAKEIYKAIKKNE
jgi:DNA polymerase III epsilon subunit-like protein